MLLLRSVVDKMITEVCGQKGAIKALNEGCLWDRTTKIKWTQGGKIIWNKQMQLFQKEFSIRTKKLQTSQVLNRKEREKEWLFLFMREWEGYIASLKKEKEANKKNKRSMRSVKVTKWSQNVP